MLLEFTYKNGRGRLALDLAALLPAKKQDIERLISFVDLSADPEEIAGKIHSFIAGRVEELKKDRDTMPEKAAEKVTAEIEKYISNNAVLVKRFNVSEISDGNNEKVSFKAATVYRLVGRRGSAEILVNTGYSFKKSGIDFKVCKSEKDKKYYVILSGTGLLVSEGTARKEAVNRIDDKIISAITGQTEKVNAFKNDFIAAMVKAGYMEPEKEDLPEATPENHSKPAADLPEEEAAADPEKVAADLPEAFESDAVTIAGKTFPAAYNVTGSGKILVFATVGTRPNGRPEKRRIEIEKGSALYTAAAAAAGYTPEATPENHSKPAADLPAVPEAAADLPKEETAAAMEPEKAADPKKARGPVPEKTFIGSTINGAGWKIFFDPAADRTRVIFTAPDPLKEAAVKEAGFYWSGNMKSYNKKLTFKAYRAALALSEKLNAIA